MAGTRKVILSTSGALAATTTVACDNPNQSGAHDAVTILVAVSAVTGTWSITPQLKIGANTIDIADAGSITSTGIVKINMTSDFNATGMAIPEPTHILFTEDVAGTITASVYAIYGD